MRSNKNHSAAKTPSPKHVLPTEVEPRAAYRRLLGEIDGVADSEVATVNIDVPTTVTTVFGVVKNVAPFAKDAAKLPDFDASCFTKLEDYALALSHAHTVYIASAAPPDDVTGLVAQATEARDVLVSDVQALAKHGLLEPSRVADVTRGLGHRGIAYDVARLVEILRENWKSVEGKTALTATRLDELEGLGFRLLAAVAEREAGGKPRSDAAVRRQKAFTLLVRAYNEVRAAVSFLRRANGDADALAPSLYAGRATPRRKDGSSPANHAPEPTTTTPPRPAEPPLDTPNAPVVPQASGLPGAAPFTT